MACVWKIAAKLLTFIFFSCYCICQYIYYFCIKFKQMEASYLITFVTLDGNEMSVYIAASSKERAILTFEKEFVYEAIKYCEIDNSENTNLN